MRTLYVLRHAKSSWDDPSLDDHERPLAPRGLRATPVVAAHMHDVGVAPDVVLCSSAVRTRQTLELLGDAVPPDATVLVEDGLYGATADELIERLQRLPADVGRPLLIGHNPGLERLVLRLAASGDRLVELTRKFPTAALATLLLDIDDWGELAPGRGRLTGFVRPKDLDAPR